MVDNTRVVRCLDEAHGDNWALYHADCVDVARQMPDNSVDLAVYSPPFSGLYIYNDSEADMGNCADDAEFLEHYRFLVREMYRVMRPGRIVAVHCKDLVFYKNQRGKAGLGEKTMLDVLIPVAVLLQRLTREHVALESLCRQVKAEAERGMLVTRDMIATKGRAHFLGERAIGHIDPGSKTCQVAIHAVCDLLTSR